MPCLGTKLPADRWQFMCAATRMWPCLCLPGLRPMFGVRGRYADRDVGQRAQGSDIYSISAESEFLRAAGAASRLIGGGSWTGRPGSGGQLQQLEESLPRHGRRMGTGAAARDCGGPVAGADAALRRARGGPRDPLGATRCGSLPRRRDRDAPCCDTPPAKA